MRIMRGGRSSARQQSQATNQQNRKHNLTLLAQAASARRAEEEATCQRPRSRRVHSDDEDGLEDGRSNGRRAKVGRLSQPQPQAELEDHHELPAADGQRQVEDPADWENPEEMAAYLRGYAPGVFTEEDIDQECIRLLGRPSQQRAVTTNPGRDTENAGVALTAPGPQVSKI